MTKEEFVSNSKIKYPEYDYSEALSLGKDEKSLSSSSDEMVIGCPVHGRFTKTTRNKNYRCPKCSGELVSRTKTIDTNAFLAKADLVHGNIYDYSEVNYIRFNLPVVIICRKHGAFLQRPDKHLQGCGCQKCGKDKISNANHGDLESFIKKAQEVHGNRYDYSESEYHSSKENIRIICHQHGPFRQSPNNHLQGKGCPACFGRPERKDDFFKEAKEKFGDRYDYSKTVYRNGKRKIIVGCKDHGTFEMLPDFHFKYGCPECKRILEEKELVLKRQELIEAANKVHKSKYDYSHTTFNSIRDKVEIVCPRHGSFSQSFSSHLKGHGCSKCGFEDRTRSYENCGRDKCLQDDFIKKCKLVHGDKYDYSLVEYVKSNQNVKIICREHGVFEQISANHLQGGDCPKCAILRRSRERVEKSASVFIQKAKEKHGDIYDYSKVVYRHARQPVTIICRKHGEFLQTPNKHLIGQGCQHCKESNGERETAELLKTNGFVFEAQKRFTWLHLQSLDFYLPSLRLAIEVQGIQHFEPTDFNGKGDFIAEVAFVKAQLNDFKKFTLCQEHGITTVYVSEEKMQDGLTFKDSASLIQYLKTC